MEVKIVNSLQNKFLPMLKHYFYFYIEILSHFLFFFKKTTLAIHYFVSNSKYKNCRNLWIIARLKIQVKQKSLIKKKIKKKHMIYQLSTHVPIEKKKGSIKKEKNPSQYIKTLPTFIKKKKSTPHIEITLSTHYKQKLLSS